MGLHEVIVMTTITQTVDVEAEDCDDAFNKVRSRYLNGEIDWARGNVLVEGSNEDGYFWEKITEYWREATSPSVDDLRRVFEEYKGKTGWRGLDAENAIESFIRFVEKGA